MGDERAASEIVEIEIQIVGDQIAQAAFFLQLLDVAPIACFQRRRRGLLVRDGVVVERFVFIDEFVVALAGFSLWGLFLCFARHTSLGVKPAEQIGVLGARFYQAFTVAKRGLCTAFKIKALNASSRIGDGVLRKPCGVRRMPGLGRVSEASKKMLVF